LLQPETKDSQDQRAAPSLEHQLNGGQDRGAQTAGFVLVATPFAVLLFLAFGRDFCYGLPGLDFWSVTWIK